MPCRLKSNRDLKKKNHTSDNSNTIGSQLQNKGKFLKRNFPPCQHYNKIGHRPFKYYKRPDAKCNKYNQMEYEATIFRKKFQKQDEDAQVATQDDEDQMFVATFFQSRPHQITI